MKKSLTIGFAVTIVRESRLFAETMLMTLLEIGLRSHHGSRYEDALGSMSRFWPGEFEVGAECNLDF